jgi:hypothetical protein
LKTTRFISVIALNLILIGILTLGSGCGGGKELTFTSTASQGHSHKVVISEGDIRKAPEEKIYTTEAGGSDGHTHMIRLTAHEYDVLKRGTRVGLTSSPAKTDDHYHNFDIYYSDR